MIDTYITSTEANYFFTNDSDYATNVKSNALETSFGMVNTYIAPTIELPVIGQWDGIGDTLDSPKLLKVCQARFYQWILESGNMGHTDELQNLYEATAEILRGIRQEDFALPTSKSADMVGWHIIERDSESNGEMLCKGLAPTLSQTYQIEITTGGYPSDIIYDVYRSDSNTAILTDQVGSFDWGNVNGEFDIRFDGQHSADEYYVVRGIPSSDVTVPTDSKTIKQTIVRI